MNSKETLAFLESGKAQDILKSLYAGEVEVNKARYQNVVNKFEEAFGDRDICLFSSPGRTEISGNHTDHNHGKVLAGSINLDCIGAAAKNDTNTIRIISETFHQDFTVSLDELERGEKHGGTVELVKGMVKGFKEFGFQTGGFDLYTSSTVISAAGVSSSAAFEMLVCTIMNHFYNDGKLNIVNYAHIGQFAENKYWDKASGLLDQMACAAGGLITIDFKNPKEPVVEKIDFDFGAQKHKLIIVNTGKGHADLSEDYSSVPAEMKKVAAFFGKEVCAEISEEQVIDNLAAVREACGDRSVLRALHFFEENKRVEEEVKALKENRFEDFLTGITESGNSSWKWLQNCFTNHSWQEQGITVALALTELFLKEKKCGACRVHGGGFAGVIMAMVPEELAEEYAAYMDKALGEGNAYRMSIRPYGAVCLNTL
ncbi:MAG: galactokinase [Lachnospiraceae bacterium]|nr:galactokinase [Lachnospiraceae bacterium]